MLLVPPRVWSMRDILDVTYTLLIDGHVGMLDILKVKKGIDESLASMVPDREEWGMDADLLDLFPPALPLGEEI